jgi:hypothetical protein
MNKHFELSHSATVKPSPEGYFECTKCQKGRSQWLRCVRRRSVPARLLGLWVQIPPGPWMPSLVSVVCCQVEVSVTDWSLVQRSPTECGCLRQGLHKATLRATHQQVHLPDSEQAEWKLALPITYRNEKAWQWASSPLVYHLTPQRSPEEF